jgi:hypothetical protein
MRRIGTSVSFATARRSTRRTVLPRTSGRKIASAQKKETTTVMMVV